MKKLYDARPFMDRMKLLVSELGLPNVDIQQRNILQFQPWNTRRSHYTNSFASYSKTTVTPIVFQCIFAYHCSQYRSCLPIFTDGSKRADYVGCGVMIEDNMHGYSLNTSCSIFTAKAFAVYRTLQLIYSRFGKNYFCLNFKSKNWKLGTKEFRNEMQGNEPILENEPDVNLGEF
ncbi:RNase H domain-containing protein [Trichonephila clavipes]|nr:RNase H domain-containing protein [Trichonephila clavipes]